MFQSSNTTGSCIRSAIAPKSGVELGPLGADDQRVGSIQGFVGRRGVTHPVTQHLLTRLARHGIVSDDPRAQVGEFMMVTEGVHARRPCRA